jgi:site-specific DNA recombinase
MTTLTETVWCALYGRESKDKAGDAHNVGDQLDAGDEFADRRDMGVYDRYTDNDISAYKGRHRPGYERLMRDAASGRFTVIVVFHTSRLWRNRKERAEGIDILKAAGVSVLAVRGPSLDMSTAYGRAMAGLLGEFDTMESEVKSERSQLASMARAREGKRQMGSPRPFGWNEDRKTLHPDESDAIRDACHAIVGGATITGICREWAKRGLVSAQVPRRRKDDPFGPLPLRAEWPRESVRVILANPSIAGIRSYLGEIQVDDDGNPVMTDWDAIVSVETWQAVSAILNDPSRKPARGVKTLGGGLFRCACGNQVEGNPTSHGQAGYRCRPATRGDREGPHVSVGLQHEVDEYVSEIVIRRLAQPDAAELFIADSEVDVPGLNTEKATIRENLTALAGDVALGIIDRPMLIKASARAQERICAIDRELADASKGNVLADVLGLSRDAWDEMDLSRRRAVIDAMMTVVLRPAGAGARRPKVEELVTVTPKQA